MPHFIAFLRGINVGGHRVKMDRLRTLFEDAGFEDVSTFISSGNVLFSSQWEDAEVIREGIELQLKEQLGYEVPTFIRTPNELDAIVAHEPPARAGDDVGYASHYVILLDGPASESLRVKCMELESDSDRFSFSGAEVHWLLRGKLSESPLFGRRLEEATRGVRTTTRNINTLQRIASKTGG
jgi:uncharacterized protein (DUF1697 family)